MAKIIGKVKEQNVLLGRVFMRGYLQRCWSIFGTSFYCYIIAMQMPPMAPFILCAVEYYVLRLKKKAMVCVSRLW